MTKHELLHRYLDLRIYSIDMIDQKIFKINHDNYAKQYQRLDQADQGWIAEQLSKE